MDAKATKLCQLLRDQNNKKWEFPERGLGPEVQTTETKSISGQKHNLNSTNQLLGSIYNIKGLKTGTTIQAGECLITLSKNKKDLITIVLASQNRFNDSKVLIDWANFHL